MLEGESEREHAHAVRSCVCVEERERQNALQRARKSFGYAESELEKIVLQFHAWHSLEGKIYAYDNISTSKENLLLSDLCNLGVSSIGWCLCVCVKEREKREAVRAREFVFL